jgi:hypothetical protein
MTPYWCVARTEQNREGVAVKFLGDAGYVTYLPRVREQRVNHGRRITLTPPLFPAYAFILIKLGWWDARWCVGVCALIKGANGEPARVPDTVIDELRGRERDGYVELPAAPCLRPGDPVKVVGGHLAGLAGLYAGMRGPDRAAVLLAALGVAVLPASSVEKVPVK